MSWFQALILGIIQGLTEFLPVSSSAHLVLVPYLVGWQIPVTEAFIFDVLVQNATLVAVIIYFWKDLTTILLAFLRGIVQRRPFEDPQSCLGWYLIIATIPAGIFGLLFKKSVEAAFSNPIMTAVFLLITAFLLVLGERLGKRSRSLASLHWLDALWIGVFQAIAVFPGISRSGATIPGGMLRNLERPAAARFSFLMSVPVMLAAGLLAFWDLLKLPNFTSLLPVFIPGFLAAGIVGYIAIRWLIGYLTRHSLYIFAIYCTVMSLFVLAFSLVK